AAKSDEEKKAAHAFYPLVEVIGRRFLALAKKYPRSSTACDALVWILGRTRQEYDEMPARAGIVEEAVGILVRDHVDDVRVGRAGLNLPRYPSPRRDKFLQTVFEKTTNQENRGCACLYLARYLVNKAHAAEIVRRTLPGNRGDTMPLTSNAY